MCFLYKLFYFSLGGQLVNCQEPLEFCLLSMGNTCPVYSFLPTVSSRVSCSFIARNYFLGLGTQVQRYVEDRACAHLFLPMSGWEWNHPAGTDQGAIEPRVLMPALASQMPLQEDQRGGGRHTCPLAELPRVTMGPRGGRIPLLPPPQGGGNQLSPKCLSVIAACYFKGFSFWNSRLLLEHCKRNTCSLEYLHWSMLWALLAGIPCSLTSAEGTQVECWRGTRFLVPGFLGPPSQPRDLGFPVFPFLQMQAHQHSAIRNMLSKGKLHLAFMACNQWVLMV